MKKDRLQIIGLILIGVILLLLVCIFAYNKFSESGTIVSSEVEELLSDFDDYYNSKERTVIYYASSSCGYCSLETPILETISKDYDMDYLYIDSSILGTKQRNEILKKLDIEHATPTTVIVEDGKVIDTRVGYQEADDYVEFFIENELIPEDAEYVNEDETNLTLINYEEYESIVSKNDTSIVVLGQTTCSHCIAIKPALNKIAKEYGIEINYLNLTDFADGEYEKLVQSLKDLEYSDSDFVSDESFGTPLTLVIENGKITNYISGERTKSQLVKLFKKFGLI